MAGRNDVNQILDLQGEARAARLRLRAERMKEAEKTGKKKRPGKLITLH